MSRRPSIEETDDNETVDESKQTDQYGFYTEEVKTIPWVYQSCSRVQHISQEESEFGSIAAKGEEMVTYDGQLGTFYGWWVSPPLCN